MAENTSPSKFNTQLPDRSQSPSKKRAISGGLQNLTNQPPSVLFERTTACCPPGSTCDNMEANMDSTISANPDIREMRDDLKAIRQDTAFTKNMQIGFNNELGEMKKKVVGVEKSLEGLHKKVDHVSERVEYIFQSQKKRDGKMD